MIDPRGNGRSDRPIGPEHYGDLAQVGDLIAVMDAVGVERALLVGLCDSAWFALLAAARHPERVDRGRRDRPERGGRQRRMSTAGIDTDRELDRRHVESPEGWQLLQPGASG